MLLPKSEGSKVICPHLYMHRSVLRVFPQKKCNVFAKMHLKKKHVSNTRIHVPCRCGLCVFLYVSFNMAHLRIIALLLRWLWRMWRRMQSALFKANAKRFTNTRTRLLWVSCKSVWHTHTHVAHICVYVIDTCHRHGCRAKVYDILMTYTHTCFACYIHTHTSLHVGLWHVSMTYTQMWAWYIHTHVCVCVCVPLIHTHVCVCVCVPLIHTHVCVCVCVPLIHTHVCVCVCVPVIHHVCVCVCVPVIHTRMCECVVHII